MKIKVTEDFIDHGFFHVLPEFELTFTRPENKLLSIRISWLNGSLWLEL